MILQIRGTSGSGKTTVMKHLLENFGAKEHARTANGRKVLVYKGGIPGTQWKFYAFGDYSEGRSAGGCDTIPTIQEVIDLLETYGSRRRTVIAFEGLLLAHSWGAMGEYAHAKYGKRYINAFLDTPVEKCLERVIKRRADRGNETVGDRAAKIEKNVYADFHRVELCHTRVLARGGNLIDIPHKRAKAFTKELIESWVLEHDE